MYSVLVIHVHHVCDSVCKCVIEYSVGRLSGVWVVCKSVQGLIITTTLHMVVVSMVQVCCYNVTVTDRLHVSVIGTI